MTSSDVNIIFEEEPVEITLNEDPVEIKMPAGQNGQSLRPRGAWSSSESYGYLDLVSYQGSSYVATKTVPTGTLPTDTGFWMLSAEKGLDGASEWGNITGHIANQTDLAQALAGKANVGDSYTKAETDTLLADKADADDVYTKDETDALLQDKAPVILNSASGSIASFTDGSSLPVENLTVAIEPVQDLHGYDNPWPAGGGKNLLKPPSSGATINGVTFTVNSDGTITANGTASVNSDFYFVGTGSSGYAYANIPSGNYIINGNDDLDSTIGSLYIVEEGGSIVAQVTSANKNISVTLSDTTKYRIFVRIQGTRSVSNAIFKPMIRLASVTDATFAPYSNICPISGHTSATVTRTGKNLFPMTLDTLEQGSITGANGNNTDANNRVRTTLIPFPYDDIIDAGYKVTLPSGYKMALRFWDRLGNYVYINTTATIFYSDLRPNYFYGHDIAYAKFVFAKNDDSAVTPSEIVNLGFQLELGSSATSYEPYQGQTVTISLGEERYGGTLDVLTGEMTVDRKHFRLSSALQWTHTSGWNTYCYSCPSGLSDILPVYNYDTVADLRCTHLKPETPGKLASSNTTNVGIGQGGSGKTIFVNFGKFESVPELKTFLDNNEVNIVYPLATPITVQLTPSQMMQTLLGQNVFFADTGDVAVTYRADTKLFIEEQIAQSETLTRKMIADIANGDLAPKSLATGDLIIVGDELRKTTAAIGNGSAITASNSTTATLADVIKALQ